MKCFIGIFVFCVVSTVHGLGTFLPEGTHYSPGEAAPRPVKIQTPPPRKTSTAMPFSYYSGTSTPAPFLELQPQDKQEDHRAVTTMLFTNPPSVRWHPIVRIPHYEEGESKPNQQQSQHSPSCLILSISDTLKEHLASDNIQPITALLQHSLQSCPGLKSTIEILQKIMEIKEMNFEETLKFVENINEPTSVRGFDFEKQNVEELNDEVQKSSGEKSDKKEANHPLCFLGNCEKSQASKPTDNNSSPEGQEHGKHERHESNEDAKKEGNLCSLFGSCKDGERKSSSQEASSFYLDENVMFVRPLPPVYYPRPSYVDIDPEIFERMDRHFQTEREMIEQLYKNQH